MLKIFHQITVKTNCLAVIIGLINSLLFVPNIAFAQSVNSACQWPETGDWIISNNCTLTNTAILPASLIVNANVRLTLEPQAKLLLDLKQHKIVVKKGGGIKLKKGAVVRQVKASELSTTTQTSLLSQTVKIHTMPGDGSIRYWNTTNFETARNALAGRNGSASGVNQDPLSEGTTNWNDGTNWVITRTFLPFDTSSLPDDANILSAKLYLTGRKYVNGGEISLVLTNQSNPEVLSSADYGTVLFAKQAENKNSADFGNSATTQAWELNNVGLSNLAKTGITKLAIVTQNDFLNQAPTNGAGNNFGLADIASSRSQPDIRPYLEITYTLNSSPTPNPTSATGTPTTLPAPSLPTATTTPIVTPFQNPTGSATFNQPYQNLSFPIPVNGQFFYALGDSLKNALYYRQHLQILSFDFQEAGRKIVEQKLAEINLNENSSYPLRVPNANGSAYIYSPQFIAFSQAGFYTQNINNSNNTFIPAVGGEQRRQLGREFFKTHTNINPEAITAIYNLGDVNTVPIFSPASFPTDLTTFQPLPVGLSDSSEIITRTISPLNPHGTDIVSNLYGTYFRSPSLTETLTAGGATPEQIYELIKTPSTAMSREQLGRILGIYSNTFTSTNPATEERIPNIIKFSSNKTNIKAGEPITLTWEVSNTDYISITNLGKIFANSGQITLYPAKTTTYKLVITNAPEITSSVTVQVDVNSTTTTQNNPLLNNIYLTTFNYDIGGQSTQKIILPGTPNTLAVLIKLPGAFVKNVTTQIVSDAQVCLENGGVQECLATCGIAMDTATLATIAIPLVPASTAVIGGLCDFSNGLIYFAQGEFIQGAVQMTAVVPVFGLFTKSSAKIVSVTIKNSALTAEEIILKQSTNSNTATELLNQAQARFLTSEERILIENSFNNQTAKNIFKNLFKPSDNITPGGTAGILIKEYLEEISNTPSTHLLKALQSEKDISNLLKQPGLSKADTDLLNIMNEQLNYAISTLLK
jgi:hypothetical protein